MSGRLAHQLNWTHFFDFLAFFGFMTLLLGADLPHAKQCRITNKHRMNAAAAIAMRRKTHSMIYRRRH